jgi:rhodanese-related sulfurtransferase
MILIILFLIFFQENLNINPIEIISAETFKEIHKKETLIDIRTPLEFKIEHIPKAKNYPLNSSGFNSKIFTFDKNKIYYIYCHYGEKSKFLAKIMKEIGFKKIYVIKGGFLSWKDENYQTKSLIPKDSTSKKLRKKTTSKKRP